VQPDKNGIGLTFMSVMITILGKFCHYISDKKTPIADFLVNGHFFVQKLLYFEIFLLGQML
jgi:hypothetical protein